MHNPESYSEEKAAKFVADIENMLSKADIIQRLFGYDTVTFSALEEDRIAPGNRATKAVLDEINGGEDDVCRYINRF